MIVGSILGVAFLALHKTRPPATSTSPTLATAPIRTPQTIAVLPLQNIGNETDIDFLRFALADEIAAVLTYNRGLDVRPTGVTRKFTGAEVDPQQIGRELRVAHVVTGHYIRQGSRLLVTLQAVDVESDKVVWQSATITAPTSDLITLQGSLKNQVRTGLLPTVGANKEYLETSITPTNQQAYDLYLRSTAVPHDEKPNREAIAMLERAIKMDATYAPAWQALGIRYYWNFQYSNGGESDFEKSNSSYERALSLDPNLVFAAGQLITNRVERGELAKAYQEARTLVKQRPDSAQAHFTMGYLSRYAGFLDDVTTECDTALRLDPGNYFFRSCAWAFMYTGNTQRAWQYLSLDAGSEWANWATPSILLREGKISQARDAAKKMSSQPRFNRPLMEAAVGLRSQQELDRISIEVANTQSEKGDPETFYQVGSILAFAGKEDAAVRMLRMAIEGNYCAYNSLMNDPLLIKLHTAPEYKRLLHAARSCQEPILALRASSEN